MRSPELEIYSICEASIVTCVNGVSPSASVSLLRALLISAPTSADVPVSSRPAKLMITSSPFLVIRVAILIIVPEVIASLGS